MAAKSEQKNESAPGTEKNEASKPPNDAPLDGASNGKSKEEERGPENTEPPVDSSLLATPKASASKGIASKPPVEESAMNYTPSPSSDKTKSASGSPQIPPSQPMVSHVPASVQQPVLQSSEQSSLASPAPQQQTLAQSTVEGEGTVQQLQPQQPPIQEATPIAMAPTLQLGTQQVVKKKKGRFKLLQDSEAPLVTAAGDTTATNGAIAPAATVAGLEGVMSSAHPTRERTLSNTSTLSAMSCQNQQPVVPPAMTPVPTTTVGSNGTLASNGSVAPVGKKKGRFVVIPADVTDPSLLRQPFPGQQGVLRQQTLQPMEQVVANPPPPSTTVAQPVLPSQEVVQQVPTQPAAVPQVATQQVPTQHVLPQATTAIAGTVQPHHLQQIYSPQYYATVPQAQVGGTQQVVQVNYPSQPQHQQQQVGPSVVQMRQQQPPRTSSSPVPPLNQIQQQQQQQNVQPPAQILVTETAPTFVVQTDDGRFHQMVAASQQHMVPIPEQQTTVPQETVLVQQQPLPQQPPPQQQHVQFQTAAPVAVPPTAVTPASTDTSKPPQATKPAAPATKRPSIQRSSSISKGAPSNVGFGKVLHFLKQMELEVTEADRTIKNQARDMKFLRDKNKELEARSRDMERKWLEEKAAKEALEAKVKSLKRKVKELKGEKEAIAAEKANERSDKQDDVAADSGKSQSRSNSLDEAVNLPLKPSGNESALDEKATTVVPPSASSNSKESTETVDTRQTSHQRSSGSDSTLHTTNTIATLPQKEIISAVGPSESIRRSSSGDVLNDAKSAQSAKATNDIPRPSHPPPEASAGIENEKMSPPRRRTSKDAVAEKVATGKSPSAKPSFKAQAVSMVDAPNGHVGGKPIASSSDSLGSASEFDPLRTGHVNSHGDGTMSTTSDPAAHGHHSTLSTGSSVASFITAPLPAQSIEFDPLSSAHQAHHQGSATLQSLHAIPAELQQAPPGPQHGYSQSMPNFVVNPSNIMMTFPVQQVDVNMMQQQGWQQNQPAMPLQSQYLPSQYTGANGVAMSQQQQYQAMQAAAVQQPQPQSLANTKANGTAADPFDELASRRAPGPGSGK